MLKHVNKKRGFHRAIATLIAAVLVLSSFSGFQLKLEAADTPQRLKVSDYKSGSEENWTAPEKEGQVFAGWYMDEECTIPYRETTGEAYAKFVDAKVLSAKKQLRSDVSHDSGTTNVRFLTSEDTLNYQSVGFSVNVVGTDGTLLNEFDLKETSAYTTLLVDGNPDPATAKGTFCEESEFFIVHTITRVPNAAFDGEFTVTPYWYTLDGTKVEGTTATFTVRNTIGVPTEEATGFDGVIANGEYTGAKLASVSGDGNYRIAVQGKLTDAGDIRLAVTVDAKTDPTDIRNPSEGFPGMSQYLFAEFGFGENQGTDCTLVKANVLGQAQNAVMKWKQSDKNKEAGYDYTTEMELWIPKSAITNNTDSSNVKLTRAALFYNGNSGIIWNVAKWVNLNNCSITSNGIQLEIPSDQISGLDGEISNGEYRGTVLTDISANKKYRISVQGHLTAEKDIRLAVTVDAKTAPETAVNPYPGLSEKLFAELGFGENSGEDCTLVKANVLGEVENAKTGVKTTVNASSEYPYSTVIEIWIPKAVITYNANAEKVRISRLALFHDTAEGDPGNNFLVARWAGINNCSVRADGISLDVPENEAVGLDGQISAEEYKGGAVTETSQNGNYKISVQGYLTEGKNIRLAVAINAKTSPGTVVNPYPGLSKYLFAEFGFGENNGNGDCKLVKANVLGQAENAKVVVKTTENANAEYRYSTVIEMWIPKSAITNNTNEDNVQITRLALFHEGDVADPGNNFLVARFVNLNNSSVTANGIRTEEMFSSQYVTYASMDGEYDESLLYYNDLEFPIADPDVIYIDHGTEEGWFYAYGTSDDIDVRGFQCWRSKDLSNWEYKGVCLLPEFGATWADSSYWAPEVIYDEALGQYLMFYSAIDDEDTKMYLSVAYASEPYGPFVSKNYVKNLDGKLLKKSEPVYDFFPETNSEVADVIPAGCKATIDAHPFYDSNTGEKYLYWSQTSGTGSNREQAIYGCRMKDWYTPDYSSVKQLTNPNYTKVSGGEWFAEDTQYNCNEGPFMYAYNGKYYLTYSASGYMSPKYHVRQAVADSPLGDFVKLSDEEGGQVIYADPSVDNVSSAGHHCFFTVGDELYIAYHTFTNRDNIDDGRSLAVDKVVFAQNNKGTMVMRANGPTYSYQPLPSVVSGYENLAKEAVITANQTASGSNVSYLNDGRIATHNPDKLVNVYQAASGESVIKLTFNDPILAKAVMVYNSNDYSTAFIEISSIELEYLCESGTEKAIMKHIPLDPTWNSGTGKITHPGAASIAEFAELPTVSVTIKVSSKAGQSLSLNEIVVLGRKTENPEPVTEIGEFSYSNPSHLPTIPVYESNTFGKAGDYESRYAFDLSNDNGTAYASVKSVFAGGNAPIYFKDKVAMNFYMETEVTVLNSTPYCMDAGTPVDLNPRIGIIVRDASMDGGNHGRFFYWNITCFSGTYSNNQLLCLTSNSAGTAVDWDSWSSGQTDVTNVNCTNGNYVKLAVARLGDTFYLIVNDQVCMVRNDILGFTNQADTASAVGFLTFSTSAQFRNYSMVTDVSQVKASLQKVGVSF